MKNLFNKIILYGIMGLATLNSLGQNPKTKNTNPNQLYSDIKSFVKQEGDLKAKAGISEAYNYNLYYEQKNGWPIEYSIAIYKEGSREYLELSKEDYLNERKFKAKDRNINGLTENDLEDIFNIKIKGKYISTTSIPIYTLNKEEQQEKAEEYESIIKEIMKLNHFKNY